MGNGESVETSPPGQPAPHTARLDVDMDQVERRCNTQQFDAEEFMVTRRGAEFPITVHSRSKLTVRSVHIMLIAAKLTSKARRHGYYVFLQYGPSALGRWHCGASMSESAMECTRK